METSFGSINVQEISAAMVRSWLASLKNDGIGSRSINRKISTLKSFFKYIIRTGSLSKNPLTGIVSPKVSKRLPVFVEERDMSTLFSHVEFDEGWNGRTGRLAMQMLYELGLRLSELVNCRESQIDFGNRQADGSPRQIPASEN